MVRSAPSAAPTSTADHQPKQKGLNPAVRFGIAGIALAVAGLTEGCVSNPSLAEGGKCKPGVEDFETRVTGGKECLAIRKVPGNPNDPRVLFYIGGDNPFDKPADLDYEELAQGGNKAAYKEWRDITKYVIARPGHFLVKDGKGYRRSSGYDCRQTEVCYKQENFESVADAIKRIIDHEEAMRGEDIVTIGAGLSGGGNYVASMAGMQNGVPFDHVLSIGGTLNYKQWINTTNNSNVQRLSRPTSPSAIDYIEGINPKTEFTIVYGNGDDNVKKPVAIDFGKQLEGKGISAQVVETSGGHLTMETSPEFKAAVLRVLESTRVKVAKLKIKDVTPEFATSTNKPSITPTSFSK